MHGLTKNHIRSNPAISKDGSWTPTRDARYIRIHCEKQAYPSSWNRDLKLVCQRQRFRFLCSALEKTQRFRPGNTIIRMAETETLQHFKDARLDQLSTLGNVAQFVSFGPDLQQRFSRITGFEPNYVFPTLRQAVIALLEHSPEGR